MSVRAIRDLIEGVTHAKHFTIGYAEVCFLLDRYDDRLRRLVKARAEVNRLRFELRKATAPRQRIP